MDEQSRRDSYWKANLRLIGTLLTIWALVSFVAALILARPLSAISIGQVPLSFWFAQQGSMIVFVCLIFVYAFMMDRIDREHDVHE